MWAKLLDISPRWAISMPVFSWSIFIRAVICHMICYNLNWPKIKLWVHYFAGLLFCLFLCYTSYPEKLEVYIPKFYKIRCSLHELYVAVIWIMSQLIICIDELNMSVMLLGSRIIICSLKLYQLWAFYGTVFLLLTWALWLTGVVKYKF